VDEYSMNHPPLASPRCLATVGGIWLCLAISGLSPILASDAEDQNRAPNRHEITIENREVVLDGNVVRVTQGDDVELVWTSDEAVELHLHGYDVALELAADEPGTMSFNARATGRFPVTSHGFSGEHDHGHSTLLYLEVYPD